MVVEEQHRHVGQRAGAETARLRQMDAVAQATALPFLVVEVLWYGRVAAIDMAAAAARRADEQLPLLAGDVDELAVFAVDEITGHTLPSPPKPFASTDVGAALREAGTGGRGCRRTGAARNQLSLAREAE